MTRNEFVHIVAFLEGAFRCDLKPQEKDAYWLLLSDLTGEQVLQNAKRYCLSQESRYGFPKPLDLITDQSAQQSAAVLAWHSLKEAVEKHGAYESVLFEDATLGAAVEAMGGWIFVCSDPAWAGKEQSFMRRDFERLYHAISARRATAPVKHVGLVEAHNGERWQRFTREPVLISATTGRPTRQIEPPEPTLALPKDAGQTRQDVPGSTIDPK